MRIRPGKYGSVRKRHKQKPTCGSRQFEWCWMALLFLAIWAPKVPAAYPPADYIHPD